MKGRDQTTPAKADTGHFENPADAEAAKQVAAGLAAGADVFGDNDDDDGTPMTADTQASAPEAAADDAGSAEDGLGDNGADDPGASGDEGAAGQTAADTTSQAVANADPAAQAAAAVPASTPLQFKTKAPTELAAAQKALLDKKADAFEKYSVGHMTAAEYNAVDSEVMLGLMSIASETALAQANTQTALQASEQALAEVKKLAKSQGLIDYEADAEAGAQFDNVAEMLAKDPGAAKLSDLDFFTRAHTLVLAMRGHAQPAPGAAPAIASAKPPVRADMTGPITLRTIPAAATPNTNGGVAEQLGRLHGLDFEDAVGGMNRQRRDEWLDS